MNESANENVVTVRDLDRRYGKTHALKNVSLDIPRGGVYGLIGENGSGKTTLIKHIMGQLRCQEGEVRVFDLDPVKHPEEVLVNIGYLSETRDLPRWMRVHQLMNYTAAFYPNWDATFAEELRELFDLEPSAKLRHLSRGQLAKAGLLIALAHRPALLVLDEPSSGLDPLVRQDILTAIIRTVAEEGRTVIFSSHLLDEVERVADKVAMIYKGEILLDDDLEVIQKTHHRFVVNSVSEDDIPRDLEGLLRIEAIGNEIELVVQGDAATVKNALHEIGAKILEDSTANLETIFFAHARAHQRKVPC